MVGRIRTHPIDPPAAQPRRHQYHHDTQVQRTAVQKPYVFPTVTGACNPKTGSLLWARSPEAPVRHTGARSSRMEQSAGRILLLEAYFRETVLAQIDNINLFYVAATRAEEELHIQFPERAGEHGAHSPVDSRFHRNRRRGQCEDRNASGTFFGNGTRTDLRFRHSRRLPCRRTCRHRLPGLLPGREKPQQTGNSG